MRGAHGCIGTPRRLLHTVSARAAICARGQALFHAGRGDYDASVAVRCSSSLLLPWIVLLPLGCATGNDDKGTFGVSIGSVTQVTSVTNPYPETSSGTTFPSDDSSLPTSNADADSNDPSVPTFMCGNGILDPNEECEGDDLDAQTCESFGYDGGQLGCTADCSYDTSQCNAAAICGDGQIDADKGESCDCGQQGSNCTPAQLGGVSCINFDSPKGVPFGGGTLTCNSPSACSYDISACTYCGDNKRNGSEDCDGADLGGQSCQSLGYDGGSLSCNVGCSYNTSACSTISCGDKQCQPGEDSCVCPEDCPEDPNTCSPCECGGQGGPACFCDIFCLINFDCCLGGPC